MGLLVSPPPMVEVTVSVMVTAVLNTCPSNVYGKPLAQTSTVTVDVSSGSWLTVMVLMVSQPPMVEVTVSVMVPAVVNTCPSNVYGKALAQTSTVTVDVSSGGRKSVM